MIIDCISDLHGHYPELEGGDLLIIAGDLTARDTYAEYIAFYAWLHRQKYKHYIFISGNHDNLLESGEVVLLLADTTYLCDSGTEFEGLKIYGSPWTHRFPGINPKCAAFTLDHEEFEDKMASIPYDDIDILVTHSPPYDILDQVQNFEIDDFYNRVNNGTLSKRNTGSIELRNGLEMNGDRIKLHVFGHIHEHGGQKLLLKHLGPNTWCVNASIVNERYEHINKSVRIVL